VTGGTSVVIRGSHLSGVSQVLFGSTGSWFTVNSDTLITATSPAGHGTVYITVVTPAGRTVATDSARFTYLPALPKITSVEPQSGPVTGGTSVIIRGSGFASTTRVLFGAAGSDFTINSDTRITATSPAGSGTVNVTVITPAGTTGASATSSFTYVSVAPRISSLAPKVGPAAGGTSVIIRGSGFTGATEVLFGSDDSRFTVDSDTQITAVSPAGNDSVNVTVITRAGTTAASSASQFQYSG